jgi:hypothetical protein
VCIITYLPKDFAAITLAKVKESQKNFIKRMKQNAQLLSEAAGIPIQCEAKDVSKFMHFRATKAEMKVKRYCNNFLPPKPTEGSSANTGIECYLFFL